jgi:hypothetical protein
MLRSRALTAATIAAATLGLSVLSAAPASAYAGAEVDAGLAFGPNGTSSRTVPTVNQGVANGDGTRAVAFTCEGVSTGDTVSTSVRACQLYVNGVLTQSLQPISLPGAFSSTAGARVSVPRGATVRVCGSVLSIFAISPALASSLCTSTVISATL